DLSFDHMPPLLQQMGTLDFVASPQVLLYQKVAGVETMEPLLMTFESDNHKRAILVGEGIWRWRAAVYLDTGTYTQFDSYIGNIVQYLSSTKARKRLEISHEPYYYENAKSVIRADYYDKNYRPQPNGQLSIVLTNNTTEQRTELPLLNKSGFYEADLGSLPPSVYDYTVRVADEELTQSGRIQILPFEV